MLRLDDSMRAGGDALIRSLLATQGPHVPEMSPASHISSSTAPAAPAEDVPFPSDGAFIPDSTDGDGGDDASGASRGEDSAGRKRSSKFRGVTKHRRSGRYEAHIWVRESGKQLYLGGYSDEAFAAEAFDVAALKCKGPKAKTNWPASRYAALLPYLESVSMDELVMAIRRQSAGFARGTSVFRGVTLHPGGRWEARLGVPGQRHCYLGLFPDEETAARAYDRALVKMRGVAAATNFPLSDYVAELTAFEAAGPSQAATPVPEAPPAAEAYTQQFGGFDALPGQADPLLQAVLDGSGAWPDLFEGHY